MQTSGLVHVFVRGASFLVIVQGAVFLVVIRDRGRDAASSFALNGEAFEHERIAHCAHHRAAQEALCGLVCTDGGQPGTRGASKSRPTAQPRVRHVARRLCGSRRLLSPSPSAMCFSMQSFLSVRNELEAEKEVPEEVLQTLKARGWPPLAQSTKVLPTEASAQHGETFLLTFASAPPANLAPVSAGADATKAVLQILGPELGASALLKRTQRVPSRLKTRQRLEL